MDENTKANCVIGVWHKWREKFWHKSGGFNLRDSLLHSPPSPNFFLPRTLTLAAADAWYDRPCWCPYPCCCCCCLYSVWRGSSHVVTLVWWFMKKLLKDYTWFISILILYVTKWRIIICIWMWSLREETIYFTPKTKKQYWIIMTYYLLWLGSNLASHPGGKGCVHQPWPGAAAIFFYVDAAHSNPRNQTEKPVFSQVTVAAVDRGNTFFVFVGAKYITKNIT